jgi:hypothetical protein
VTATRDRHFRCDDDLWAAAKEAAAAEGRTVSAVLVAALRRLVANGPRSRCLECGAEQ